MIGSESYTCKKYLLCKEHMRWVCFFVKWLVFSKFYLFLGINRPVVHSYFSSSGQFSWVFPAPLLSLPVRNSHPNIHCNGLITLSNTTNYEGGLYCDSYHDRLCPRAIIIWTGCLKDRQGNGHTCERNSVPEALYRWIRLHSGTSHRHVHWIPPFPTRLWLW